MIFVVTRNAIDNIKRLIIFIFNSHFNTSSLAIADRPRCRVG